MTPPEKNDYESVYSISDISSPPTSELPLTKIFPVPLRLAREAASPESYEYVVNDQSDWLIHAKEMLDWEIEPTKSFEGDFSQGDISYFADGNIDILRNCITRHCPKKIAIRWEPDDPNDEIRLVTFGELGDMVLKISSWISNLNILSKGDAVTIYMPMVPETVAAMLAVGNLGLVHNVVFAGFSAESLADRIRDSRSRLLLTADEAVRGGKTIGLKKIAENAILILGDDNPIIKTLIYRRTGSANVPSVPDRDFFFSTVDDILEFSPPSSKIARTMSEELNLSHPDDSNKLKADKLEIFNSKSDNVPENSDDHGLKANAEDPLFILYTSGSTGKPKGLLHTRGGYLFYALWTFRRSFAPDLKPDSQDVFGCLADIGWITGHTYVVYGPLLAGVTSVLFESTPFYPTPARYWQTIVRHGVTHLYTAPTVIRALMRHPSSLIEPYKAQMAQTLRILGTVGEPINPEAWLWLRENIGIYEIPLLPSNAKEEFDDTAIESREASKTDKTNASSISFIINSKENLNANISSQSLVSSECAVVDTYWQTETGGHVIAPDPLRTPTLAGSATFPLPGIHVCIIDPHAIVPKKCDSVDSEDVNLQSTNINSVEEADFKQVDLEKKYSTKAYNCPAANHRSEASNVSNGVLVISEAWPGIARSIWGDHQRYRMTYFDPYPGYFYTGDRVTRDSGGYLWIRGRVDDVINVSGHRLSTAEIEAVLARHPSCTEAAVLGRPDDITGQSIWAFAVPKVDFISLEKESLRQVEIDLVAAVRAGIGPFATPRRVILLPDLPKTRSGKIMRRLIRKILEGCRDPSALGDTTTLMNPEILTLIIDRVYS